jgi:hypothetical protein
MSSSPKKAPGQLWSRTGRNVTARQKYHASPFAATREIDETKAALPCPASTETNGALPQKPSPAVTGALIQQPTLKTRSTAEAWSKKGQFYKPLPKEFRHGGFQYCQIAREKDAAIYEQTWIGCPEPGASYEVIRIRRRDGFLIGGRFVEPAEVYPAPEFWGRDGFTFTDRNKASAKFFEMSLEEPERTRKEVNLKWESLTRNSSATLSI